MEKDNQLGMWMAYRGANKIFLSHSQLLNLKCHGQCEYYLFKK